jgi:hypothetical protein
MKHVLLAACRQNETAADASIGSSYQGAWTWGLTSTYKAMKSPSIERLFGAAAGKTTSFGQHPILEGPNDLVAQKFL